MAAFFYRHCAYNRRGKQTKQNNLFKVQYLAGRAGTATPGLFHSKASVFLTTLPRFPISLLVAVVLIWEALDQQFLAFPYLGCSGVSGQL